MTKSLIIASIMIPALLTSCGEGSKGTTASQEQTTATDSLPLIGRTLHIDYGQMQAIVTYGQDTLIWQTSSPDGKTSLSRRRKSPTTKPSAMGAPSPPGRRRAAKSSHRS